LVRELDFQIKKDFNLAKDGTINIFWEGLGSSYLPFSDINRIFSPIKDKYNFIEQLSNNIKSMYVTAQKNVLLSILRGFQVALFFLCMSLFM
jgi:hypothetical protein